MLLWINNSTRIVHLRHLRGARVGRLLSQSLPSHHISFLSLRAASTTRRHASDTERLPFGGKWQVFQKISVPNDGKRLSTSQWMTFLEPCLPLGLRRESDLIQPSELNAQDLAEILLAAHGSRLSHHQHDLLVHLGSVQGRWRAVTWIVKHLVDHFGERRPSIYTQMIWPWDINGPLHELTSAGGIVIPPSPKSNDPRGSNLSSPLGLKLLTEDSSEDGIRYSKHSDWLREDALGHIWYSLGRMVVESANEEVPEEVLEIIAYLHHNEIMPRSIYSHQAFPDLDAIQQPPILHLLSSRILTSLSDAAWRAHEKLAIEQNLLVADSSRASPPGTIVKLNVARLRPEIWLELILWTCLQGGWAWQGAQLLRKIIQSKRTWTPLSWSTLEDNVSTGNITNTVSSEVVHAYIDVVLSLLSEGEGHHGINRLDVMTMLQDFRKFLFRSRTDIVPVSWEAIAARYMDTVGDGALASITTLDSLNGLLAQSGVSMQQYQRNRLSHIRESGTTLINYHHRALHHHISAGNFEGSLVVFKSLQSYIDNNRRASLAAFFFAGGERRPRPDTALFTNNYSTIKSSTLDPQLPTSILGPFLQLATDSDAFDFGGWLIRGDVMEEPLIPPRLYSDPHIFPALLQFTTKSNDQKLLAEILSSTEEDPETGERRVLSRESLPKLLGLQIQSRRWDMAERTLEHMHKTARLNWTTANLARVIAAMLLHSNHARGDAAAMGTDLVRSREIFQNLLRGKYDVVGVKRTNQNEVKFLLAMLASVNHDWDKQVRELTHLHGFTTCQMSAEQFNIIVEAVVQRYGSVAGRRLLGIFWPLAARAQGDRSLPRRRPRLTSIQSSPRVTVLLQKSTIKFYAKFRPNILTIRLIFRQALSELKDSNFDSEEHEEDGATSEGNIEMNDPAMMDASDVHVVDLSPLGMVMWAIQRLRHMNLSNDTILFEIEQRLDDAHIQQIHAALPDLFEPAQETIACDNDE